MSRTLLAIGYHDPSSPRHRSVCRQLEQEGWRIVECRTTARGYWGKPQELLWQARQRPAEAVLVTFPGHYLVPLAWLITRLPRRRLLFDAFISLHDTLVNDRQIIARWNPRAWWIFLIDWLSCHLADEVLIDTEAHRQFLIRRFRLAPRRVRTIYLTAREDLFFPQPSVTKDDGTFRVFFCGNYIPLQGVEHILRAAALLQERGDPVRFTLVGSGQTAQAMQKLGQELRLTNTDFRPVVPLEDLPPLIRQSHLCLGIFGTSDKAARVIPHKVYDAVACGIPVLTRDSPAIRERFYRHPLVILCRAGDPSDIAAKIEEQRARRTL